MQRTSITLAALILAFAVPVHGQESRYVPIPFDGNLESLFKDRLWDAKNQPLLDLVDRIVKAGNFADVDRKAVMEGLKTNPAWREFIREHIEKIHAMQEKGLKPNLDDIQELKKLPSLKNDGAVPNDSGRRPPPHPAGNIAPLEAPKPPPDALDRWLRAVARRVEESNLGDWLRDSPAFRNGLHDLEMLANLRKDPSAWGLSDLPEHLRLGEALKMDWGILERVKEINPPELPYLNLPQVNFGGVNLGGWSLPSAPVPRLGGASAGDAGRVLLWLLVIVVTAILAWQLTRRLGLVTKHISTSAALGPWPVDPNAIATRGQLVQAFDYLAVLLLGTQARSWNHRAIAKKLKELNPKAGVAEVLAGLYEEARYTSGPDELSSAEQIAARRHLCLLAGVSAP